MEHRVLIAGQCSFDFGGLTHMFRTQFHAHVDAAASESQLQALAGQHPYDLVLVNRVFDADGTSGLEVIRAWVADEKLSPIPIMLVSNFDWAQQEAVEAGAQPGFGKQSLHSPETLDQLRPFFTHK
jgi:CheY-like chemotaxis protein